MPVQPQQAAAADQLRKQAASPAAGPPQQQPTAKTVAAPAEPVKHLKQQQTVAAPAKPVKQQQQQQQRQRKRKKQFGAPSSSLSHSSPQDAFYLRVNNPEALMLSKRLLRTLFQDSTWPPVLQIRVPGAAALLPAATESATSGRLLGRKGWSAVAAALSAGARAPLQQGSVLHIMRPLSGTTGELRMRLIEGEELTNDVQTAAALTASTHWTSSVGYLHYEPTREGSGSGKRQRSGSIDAAPPADKKKREARPCAPAPPSSVPAADGSLTIPAPPPAVAAAASGVTAQQQPKAEAVSAHRNKGSHVLVHYVALTTDIIDRSANAVIVSTLQLLWSSSRWRGGGCTPRWCCLGSRRQSQQTSTAGHAAQQHATPRNARSSNRLASRRRPPWPAQPVGTRHFQQFWQIGIRFP